MANFRVCIEIDVNTKSAAEALSEVSDALSSRPSEAEEFFIVSDVANGRVNVQLLDDVHEAPEYMQ